jgi:hypothetical protein
MAGDAFKRVTSGDKLTIAARAWNACLDAAEANRDGVSGGGRNVQFRQADIVLVKNSSGSTVDRFGVLGISGVIFSPSDKLEAFQDQVAFTGVTPTTTDHTGKFLVCLEPIATGKVGRAWIAGVCQVQVDITDTTHRFCDVRNSDRAKLASSSSGSSRILYSESGTGTKWCVVRINDPSGGDPVRLGKTASAWIKGTTATINVWESGTPPSETQTSGVTLSNCVNKFANVATGKWVIMARGVNGSYYLIAAECS